MRFFKYKIFSIVGGLALSSLSFAYDFKTADDLFRERGEGAAKATEARKCYAKALDDKKLTLSDKVYAVGQMSRLDLYQGAMAPGVSLSDKKKVLESCVKNLDTHLGKSNTQEYYYYYLACVAFRGKFETRNPLPWALKLKRVYKDAIASMNGEVPYEGGGILRVLSAVKGNPRADALRLYNPVEAVAMATKALETESTEVRPYPQELSGQDYHENAYYLGLAELSLAMDKNDMAKAKKALLTIRETMANVDEQIEDGALPEGREPETEYYREKMEESASMISRCLERGSKWKVCLKKNL